MEISLDDRAGERYCYLTTQGRVTGRRHTAELWWVAAEGGIYLMSGSGGLTQWYLNLQAEERAVVRIGDGTWLARAALLRQDAPRRPGVLDRFHDRYDRADEDRRASWARSAAIAHLVFVRELTD